MQIVFDNPDHFVGFFTNPKLRKNNVCSYRQIAENYSENKHRKSNDFYDVRIP